MQISILLIEDSHIDEIAILRLFRKTEVSVQVTRVSRKQSYIDALEKDVWDIILCDYYLPDFNGLEALQIYQQTEKDVPFVIVSGFVGEETAVELMRNGARDYVMKDNLQRLPEVIKREIREYKSRKARFVAQTELIESNKINQAIFQAIPDGIVRVDCYGNLLQQMSGGILLETSLLEKDIKTAFTELLFSHLDRDVLAELIQRSIQEHSIEIFFTRITLQATKHDYEIRISPLDEYSAILVIRDVTQQKKVESQLVFNATHDTLTGLANRKNLNERLQLNLNRLSRSSNHRFGLLYLDFDQFKAVNDTYGHDTGDQLLVLIATKLIEATRSVDLCARLGGDEFIIILDDIHKIQQLIDAANRVLEYFQQAFKINALSLQMTPSMGLVFADDPKVTINELLRTADLAMYEAKRNGGNCYHLFNAETYSTAISRIRLESNIKNGIQHDQFELFYQPILTLSNLECESLECLLRWNHPEYGLMTPVDFLEVAEETDLICQIDNWVIQNAVKQWKFWEELNIFKQSPKIGINLSTRSLGNPNLVKFIQIILNTIKVDPKYINFEITESLLIQDIDKCESILRSIKSLGSSISLDDFGTGYSALNYLPDLSFDYLKIDRSFTRNICVNKTYYNIISTIVKLGHELGKEVIVEGIENHSQVDLLLDLGCQKGQGFLFSPPMPSNEVGTILEKIHLDMLRV